MPRVGGSYLFEELEAMAYTDAGADVPEDLQADLPDGYQAGDDGVGGVGDVDGG
jgi:hypothetical protein